MPIPPRPIPTTSRHRPGSSVPRKSLPSSHLDWRSEVALLNEMPHPKSVPAASGVNMVDRKKAPGSSDKTVGGGIGKCAEEEPREEVGLEGLIKDGKGKREKRATTATTLGFDFIPNSSILALPESVIPTAKPSLLTSSKTITLSPATSSCPSTTLLPGVSPVLSATPSTPGLLPVAEEDLLEWEHIDLGQDEETGSDVEEGSDEDVIVLGELELEDELEGVEKRREKRHAKRVEKGGKRLSYAKMAMLGKVVVGQEVEK